MTFDLADAQNGSCVDRLEIYDPADEANTKQTLCGTNGVNISSPSLNLDNVHVSLSFSLPLSPYPFFLFFLRLFLLSLFFCAPH